jgi:hypothetical protein
MDGGVIMSTKFAAGPVKVPGSNRIPSGSNRRGEFCRAEDSRSATWLPPAVRACREARVHLSLAGPVGRGSALWFRRLIRPGRACKLLRSLGLHGSRSAWAKRKRFA